MEDADVEDQRFDGLMRAFGHGTSRRGVLGLLAGVAGLGVGEIAAKRPQQGRRASHRPGTDKDNRKGKRTGGGNGGPPGGRGPGAPCLPPTADLQASLDAADPGATLTLCAGTWSLSATLLIKKEVTIVGTVNGGLSVLNGSGAVQVVGVRPNIFVAFTNVTVTNGNNVDDSGGGIFNQGELTLTNCQVEGNVAQYGGGIYNQGVLRLNRGAITNNSAKGLDSLSQDHFGGGIYNEQGGTIYVSGTMIAHNSALREANEFYGD